MRQVSGFSHLQIKLHFIQRGTTDKGVKIRERETHSMVLTSEIRGRDEDKEDIIKLLF